MCIGQKWTVDALVKAAAIEARIRLGERTVRLLRAARPHSRICSESCGIAVNVERLQAVSGSGRPSRAPHRATAGLNNHRASTRTGDCDGVGRGEPIRR